jgi:hypothetical protein
MKCEAAEVLLLNYRSNSSTKHSPTVIEQFTKSYENDQEPVFRLLDREKCTSWESVVCYVCRREDVANSRRGIKNVVVIKAYDIAVKCCKFLGLVNLDTMTFNEVHVHVRQLLDASEEGPFLPDFRMFLEPPSLKHEVEELTPDFRWAIPPASVIVAEVRKAAVPDYVPGEFMQLYRDMDNMVTLEVRHAAAPSEEVHPTFKHWCLRTVLCQDIVNLIAQNYRLNPSFIRLLQHDAPLNVPKKNSGYTSGHRPVEQMFDFVRKHLKEHTLHFEVLNFDVTELQTKKLMRVFICAPSAAAHVKDLLPLEWTASEICQHYQQQYPSLAGASLRVLLVGANRLTEQLAGSKTIQDAASIDDIRIEIIPPAHMNLPPQSLLVPVQLFNKNAGAYLISSLLPHPFYVRVDPDTIASSMLREILSGLCSLAFVWFISVAHYLTCRNAAADTLLKSASRVSRVALFSFVHGNQYAHALQISFACRSSVIRSGSFRRDISSFWFLHHALQFCFPKLTPRLAAASASTTEVSKSVVVRGAISSVLLLSLSCPLFLLCRQNS